MKWQEDNESSLLDRNPMHRRPLNAFALRSPQNCRSLSRCKLSDLDPTGRCESESRRVPCPPKAES